VRTVSFLRELILLRDNTLVLSNNLGFSREELNVFIIIVVLHSFTIMRDCLLLLLFFAIATLLVGFLHVFIINK